MTAAERGKKILEDAIANPKCPADKKATYQMMLADEFICEAVGTNGLRQDEFSSKMAAADDKWNKAEKWHQELNTYHQTKKKELDEELPTLRKKLAELESSGHRTVNSDDTPLAPDLSNFVPKDELEKRVGAAIDYATNYGAYIAGLAVKHQAEFGEVLDTGALLAFCRDKSLPIDRGGYDNFVYEKRSARVKADSEKALKEAEDRGYRRGLNESNSAPPYPVSTGGSTLDGLDPANKGKFGVAAAVKTYESEVQKKVAGA